MKSRLPYALVVFFIVAGFTIGLILINKNKPCQEAYPRDVTIKVDGRELYAQKALTEKQKTIGLGGKRCIGQNQAMLFGFDKPGYYPFWMKDMKFNIDVVWVDKNHQVVSVEKNLSPSTYPKTFTNTIPAVDVIELQAGNTDRLGISTGTKLSY